MNARNRNLLRATLVASALMPATLAAAADLPLPPPLPVWTWSGFYLGGSAGAAAGTATFSESYGPSIFGDKVNTAAFLAGLQLGYNWQVAPRWVVGLQADASYLDSNGTYTCMQASAEIVGSNCQVSPRVLASLTGRVGFLVDPLGRTLIYGKGGGAWMNSDISITPNNSFGPPTFPNAPATGPETNGHGDAWGWTVGAGIERALTPAWSVGLEYDYYRFATADVSAPNTISSTGGAPPAFKTVAGSAEANKTSRMNFSRCGSGAWNGARALFQADKTGVVTCPPRTPYSNPKMRFQSFFMSTMVHLFSAAASGALSRRPKAACRRP
jgi:opacity protein-like surface antigen